VTGLTHTDDQAAIDTPEDTAVAETPQDTTPAPAGTAPPTALVGEQNEQADTSVAAALNELLLRAVVAKYNADRAEADAAEAKHVVVQTLRRGATQVAVSPLDANQELAQINVSQTTWTAATVARTETEEWVKARYADKVEKKTRLLPTVTEQDVFNVLRTFAPYLLEEIDVVPDHVIRELELKSEQAHEPMGWGGEIGDAAPPGIRVFPSNPKVTVTFRDTQAIDALVDAGVITVDGHMVGGAR
jgi:hypothetical protein